MTFDEWWGKTEKDEEIKNREVIYKNLAKLLAHDAWRTAQKEQFLSDIEASPKWTYCKDGMPTEKDGKFEGTGIFNSSVFNVLHSNGTVASMYYYRKLKAFGTSDGVKVYSCNDVIAWMSLPEAPNVHDD